MPNIPSFFQLIVLFCVVYRSPRKREQLIEGVKEEWDELTKKQQMNFVESFQKRMLECHGNNGRHSTFEKPASLTHCNNKFSISYF